jgi:hypothetical protein
MTRVVRTRLHRKGAWRSSKAMRDSRPGVGFPLWEARRLEVS